MVVRDVTVTSRWFRDVARHFESFSSTCEIIHYTVILLNYMLFIFKNIHNIWPSWGECYVCNFCTPLNDISQLLHSFTPRRVSRRWLNHTQAVRPHRVTSLQGETRRRAEVGCAPDVCTVDSWFSLSVPEDKYGLSSIIKLQKALSFCFLEGFVFCLITAWRRPAKAAPLSGIVSCFTVVLADFQSFCLFW